MNRLQVHESCSLDRYANQSFDLIVSLVDPKLLNLERLRITAAAMTSREFDDFAWIAWRDHNFPKTIAGDNKEVFEKYCKQTALLAAYAEELVKTFLTEESGLK
jgi:hypothetical protein